MKNIFILAIIFVLASCAPLRPLYAKSEDVKNKLSSVEIEEIDTVNGAELYHNLTNLIGSSEDSSYLLKISTLSDVTSALAITGRANVVKQNVTQQYGYSLIDKKSGKIVDSGKIRIIGSYSTVSAPYTSYTNEKFLKKNLAQNAAEEIYMRLLLYFSKVES